VFIVSWRLIIVSRREFIVSSRLFIVLSRFWRRDKKEKRADLSQPFCATHCGTGIWFQTGSIPKLMVRLQHLQF
jgi:hypothetical protein